MRTRRVAVTAVVVITAALAACSSENNISRPQTPTTTVSPEPAPSGSVWVADEGGDSLTVLDASTNAVTTTVRGLKKPHNVQVGRDSATVYAVSSSNNLVVAIDAATYTVEAAASTGPAPAHVIDAPSGRVYVTNTGDGTVSVYQTPGLQPVGRINLGGMPHGLRPAAGGSVIVVANTMAGALDLIDPAADTFLGAVPVGTGPAQVAVTADGRYAYAGITAPASVVKVDLHARTVVGSAPVSAPPVQLYLTPDEATVLSADQGTPDKPGHTVSVIDAAAMTVRSSVPTGAGPHGVVVDTSGTRAWVTNTYDNTVSAINLGSMSVVATVAVGAEPSGISYSPRPPAAFGATATLNIPTPPTNDADRAQQPPPDQHGH
ncbi:conserved exported hypothetical protein [uncultured Mycobacterium sp.]|uniref:YNCE-like beta-propeller domain-containing protein n=2 Tax=Mycobacteriaceae TaxID=1762 RepID=A0A064CED0_9MYCO|nr:hypothetical protein [Mycolicibacterium aromaticivorans]KDE97107.1 hypothetical protein Y900_027860 [Mycolicibacterium aromaticivorans JS19b1 = JCM 16368]SBS79390.1 conserved exported hypothetical protein [uncultured Mycobacterium sp.]